MITRCPKCNKLIFKYELKGYLKFETICPRCGYKIVSEISTDEYNVRSFKKRNFKSKR